MAKTQLKPKQDGARCVFSCRLSYAHLDEPWSNSKDIAPKYCVTALIPKTDTETLAAIRAAQKAAKAEGISKTWKGVEPRKLTDIMHDGDEDFPDNPDYAGHIYFAASSKTAVPTLNLMKEDINPAECYSGCYALVSVKFFPYDTAGNKGVGAGLNAVLKLADGEPLGGAGNARADFDSFDLTPDTGDLLGNL